MGRQRRASLKRRTWRRIGRIGLAVALFGVIGHFTLFQSKAATYAASGEAETAVLDGNAARSSEATASGGSAVIFGTLSNPVISRAVASYASSGTAARANDGDYNTSWRSTSGSGWLAYNLGAVPSAYRSSVLLAWYNDTTEAYDPLFIKEAAADYPKNYTIETNTATSSTVPTSGWTVKATVTGNAYHSRQHVIDMGGAQWVRLNVSASYGSASDLNMDLYPASQGLQDSWIFYGSSTPATALSHKTIGSNTKTVGQAINAARPGVFPAQENGSTSGLDTNDGIKLIGPYLNVFPGKYVVIGLGANDADPDVCMSTTQYYNNMVTMVKAAFAAGKTVVVPTFNWAPDTNACGPAIVAGINKLYTTYPQIIKGPDFWSYYKAHPELISSDRNHPTTAGMAIFRQMWVDTMLQTVYK